MVIEKNTVIFRKNRCDKVRADRRGENPHDVRFPGLRQTAFSQRNTAHARRDTYLKIKVKIKHLQKLKLNIFPVKIKHSLDKKFSKFDKKLKKFL